MNISKDWVLAAWLSTRIGSLLFRTYFLPFLLNPTHSFLCLLYGNPEFIIDVFATVAVFFRNLSRFVDCESLYQSGNCFDPEVCDLRVGERERKREECLCVCTCVWVCLLVVVGVCVGACNHVCCRVL